MTEDDFEPTLLINLLIAYYLYQFILPDFEILQLKVEFLIK